jgi:hypothetical protein
VDEIMREAGEILGGGIEVDGRAGLWVTACLLGRVRGVG